MKRSPFSIGPFSFRRPRSRHAESRSRTRHTSVETASSGYVRRLSQEMLETRWLLTALDDYVAAPDPNFAFALVSTETGTNYTAYTLSLTSQQWRTAAEVNNPIWQHWMQIVVPNSLASTSTGLFLVDGGANTAVPPAVLQDTITAAVSSRLITIDLRTIPNQPLIFTDLPGEQLTEDEIIAYSFDKFLDTGDPTWPVLLPMVKAVVRGMDATQSFLQTLPTPRSLDNFIIAGASKRGWTTYLTAAVDTRIRALSPAVFDGLNLDEQFVHQIDAYGELGPALQPYVDFDIPSRINTPLGQQLLTIVDPYEYRTRITQPMLATLATGDEFFVPDSSQLYFKDLVGEKYLRYAPNVGHDLDIDPALVLTSLTPVIVALLTNQPRPQFTWTVQPDNTIRIVTTTPALEVRLWQASDPDGFDYRQTPQATPPVWTFTVLTSSGGGVYTASVPVPTTGTTAFYADLIFAGPIGAPGTYGFSTELVVVKAPTFPPVTQDDNASTFEEESVIIDVLSNDAPGDQPIDPATLEIVTQPGANAGVAVVLADRRIQFTPATDFSGNVSFFYRVKDTEGKVSRLTQVTVNVVDVNDPPEALPDDASTLEDTPVAIPVLANDKDIDDPLNGSSIVIVTTVEHGSLQITPAGVVIYTPAANYFGPDAFSYMLVDARGLPSNTVDVTIDVISVNDPPFAVDDVLIAPVGGDIAFDILSNDLDPDDVLTADNVIIVRGPVGGSLQKIGGILRYIATPGYFGGDLITYRLRDAAGELSNLATVRMRVGDPVSFSGRVYHDANGNGKYDAGELGIPGIQIVIQGQSGPLLINEPRFTTAPDGTFDLSEASVLGLLLPGGQYTITQMQSSAFVNGSTETAILIKNGAIVGGVQGTLDQYGSTLIADGVSATNLNFGELGVSSLFIAQVPGGKFFLASAGTNGAILAAGGATQALNLTQGDVWYSLDGSWNGVLSVILSSNPAQGSATVGLYDSKLKLLASSSNPGSAAFNYTAKPGESYFVKLSGTNVDVDLQMANTPNILPSPNTGGGVGVFNPQTATFYLRDTSSAGWPDLAPFNFGQPGWIAITGDWDGDGGDSIGLYNTTTSTFYLRNVNNTGVADLLPIHYGMPGWKPIVGDWDGDGIDTIGVFDPNSATFYLRNTNDSGVADLAFHYGAPGWTPVAGDWNNDQVDTIGVYNQGAGTFYLRNANGSGAVDTPVFAFGAPGWVPVVGDFNNDLYDTVGVFNPQTAQFYLRNANTWGAPDVPVFSYGAPGWMPIVGHWRSLIFSGESLDATSHTGQWAPTLQASKLAPLVKEAVGRWLAAGIDPRGAAQLAHAKVQIVDLPGTQVGRTVGNMIYLDINAAGNGWFVDSTPGSDDEFTLLASGQLAAKAGTTATGKIDLLTVLSHELGHVMGLDESDPYASDVMADLLAPGVRRNPSAAAVDELLSQR